MIIGIDASNLRRGGGITHLVELLNALDPVVHGIKQVIVWGGEATLAAIKNRDWLIKEVLGERNLFNRVFWQRYRLSKHAATAGCDLLFIPGGLYIGTFEPIITMSQNMLPYEKGELWRYGWSLLTLKFIILRWMQLYSFQKSEGLIFLTDYAQRCVTQLMRRTPAKIALISHGVDRRFVQAPRVSRDISTYSDQPFKILYVSIVDVYKHQWHVAEAVVALRKLGFPVALDLIGPSYPPALRKLNKMLDQVDPNRNMVRYLGSVPYSELHSHYVAADLCVFASSCENLPIILLEGMASGLPIACSNRGPMPEVLGDAGIYFDPEKPIDIASALKQMIENHHLRDQYAQKAFERAQSYTWQRCAYNTFDFIKRVVSEKKI